MYIFKQYYILYTLYIIYIYNIYIYIMEVSWNRYPQIINFNGIFPYKPSIWYPQFRKSPYLHSPVISVLAFRSVTELLLLSMLSLMFPALLDWSFGLGKRGSFSKAFFKPAAKLQQGVKWLIPKYLHRKWSCCPKLGFFKIRVPISTNCRPGF